MEWYLKVLRQYADFEGRARRTEYWMFTLINFVIGLVLSVLSGLLIDSGIGALFSILSFVYSLAVLIPGIAVSVRRLHDVDKSGWLLLIIFIPLIGAILLIVWFATEGTSGPNQYGRDPKGGDDSILFDDSDILDAGL